MLWKIDKDHSLLEFSTKHMMIATVRGWFTDYDAVVDLNEDDLTQSSLEVTVNVASLNTGNEQRDAHLRSAEFLDVERYPKATFYSTRIERIDDNNYRLYGDATIKGMTREVSFRVTDEGRNRSPWGTELWGFSAQGTINRKDFGLTWNVALETGGWLVGEQVNIRAELELTPAQPVAEEEEAAVAVG
jgi:polyisoprenoid-binding protein YceI